MSPYLFALIAAVTLGVIGFFISDDRDPLKALFAGVLFYGVAWILATGAQRLRIRSGKDQ